MSRIQMWSLGGKEDYETEKGLECFAWVILTAVLILVNAAAANADEFSGQEYLAAGKDAASLQ